MQVQNLLERWVCAVACTVGVVGLAWGTAPTVTVSEFDAATGAVELSITSDKPAFVYVVGDQTDKGSSFDSGWSTTNCLGCVAAGQATFSGRLPSAVRASVKKVRFFVASHPSGNPVAYITSSTVAGKTSDQTVGSWIDTGYTPKLTSTFETYAQFRGNCVAYGYGSALCYVVNDNGSSSTCFFGNWVNFSLESGVNNRFHVWKQSVDGVYYEGEKQGVSYKPSMSSIATTMPLFCRRTAHDAGDTFNKMGVMSIAWFKITEGDDIKRDFIAWKKPDGTGCLLDQASGETYDNKNPTYPFSCGEDLDYDLTAPYMSISEGSAVQTLAGASISVSNLTLTQSATSHRVEIGYTLDAAAIVTAQVLVDGRPVNGQHLAGDVNLELDAGDHTFYWFPDRDAPGVGLGSVTVNVEAWPTSAPPAYIAFDMRWQGGELKHPPRFFNSTNELSGTIDSDLWRTDYLLMRRINAAGSIFRMGQPGKGAGFEPRYVTFTNDFYIGVFELTQGQFVNCVTNVANPSKNHVKVGDTWRACPLDYISVTKFRLDNSGGDYVWPHCGREAGSRQPNKPLAMMRLCTGAMLDLPTEAQWEFACRAGTGSTFYNGTESFADSQSRNNRNPSGNSVSTWTTSTLPSATVDQGGSARVGSFAPNPWGLYDMYGNVWETCLDQYASGSFEQNTLETPFVEPVGSRTVAELDKVNYVRRGNGWGSNVNGGSYERNSVTAGNDNTSIGYRLVCPVPYGKVW